MTTNNSVPWVTQATAVVGLALLVYGTITRQLDFDQATQIFVLIGGFLGVGRKLDRIHVSQKRAG